MIILTLGGGLGNQMFQYAFARYLQKETGDDGMKLSAYTLAGTGNSEKMLFHLNVIDGMTFCSETEEAKVQKLEDGILNQLRYYRVLNRFLGGTTSRYLKHLSKKGIYTTCSVYDKQDYVITDAPVKFVFGGFQTPLYFEKYADEIRAELLVKEPPSEANRKLIEEMRGCESVCVHIRRGDYLAPQYVHLNICDESYYMTAMKRMKEQRPNAVFYIFSNNHEEISWIATHYDFTGYEVRYVDLDNPDYEELRLMYSCRHFIISNSTYSWWGQFLSDHPDKIVMAPSVWNREMAADGIYMANWQVIPVE